jgi:type II secretion system protein H
MLKSGFTMIELLVVLAIIAVIATISIPAIDSMTSPKHALRKEGRRVMTLMTEARTAAMARKVRIELRVDPEAREIRMVEAEAYRSLMQEQDPYFAESDEVTNLYKKIISFDEDIELDAFAVDQIVDETEKEESVFQTLEEPAGFRVSEDQPEGGFVAISFTHFGGSDGGGIGLGKGEVRLDIAADLLTGRPKIVKRESVE